MPHTKSAEKRLRQAARRRTVNKQATRRVKLAVRAVRDALADRAPDWAEVERRWRAAQKLLDWAGGQRYLHPNKASRLVSRLAAAVARAKGSRTVLRNGRTPMRWFDELQAKMARTATPAARLASLRAELERVRARYPDRWVVYRDTWDAEAGRVTVQVLGEFPTRRDALAWSFGQPEEARAGTTLMFAAGTSPDVRVNPQAVDPRPA